jgi:signal transduction histidine kinase
MMLFLVKDIQDLSQMERKTFIVNVSSSSLQNVVKDCVSILQSKAEEKKLDLVVELPSHIPPRMLTDENRVKQILINLISNGIKYT